MTARVLMGRLERELRDVEAGLAAQIRRHHLRAQAGRLVAGVAGAVLLSVLTGGPGPLDWRAIGPVALGALWTQLRAIWPTVPWAMIWDRVGLPASARSAAPVPPAGPGGAGTP